MARRIDYLDDPNAPTPNSLKPSVNAIVQNAEGSVLLIRRTHNDKWSLPGGAIDLGETVRQAAVRETLEETGIRCEITGIAGITAILDTSSSTPATARSAKSSPSCYPRAP